jgi:hypothetical protein
MSAEFKSHVLRRDEKGFFGVPFKRLLLGGVGGGLTYTVLNLGFPRLAIPIAAVTALAIVILTGTRGGLPLWQRLVLRLRGTLLLVGVREPHSLLGRLAQSLELPVELARIEGAKVFAPPAARVELDWREWVTFAQAHEADDEDGLAFFDSPLTPEPSPEEKS